jgi:uncharacterized protein YndB with AHSA1/START domain
MTQNEIELEQMAEASPARVWEALIRPGLWWNEGATLEPRIGGKFFEPWTAGGVEHRTFGTITQIDAPHLLAMGWRDEDWEFETAVSFSISGQGNAARILLRHGGWEGAPASQRDRLLADHREGWSRHLRNLAACAASMIDKD